MYPEQRHAVIGLLCTVLAVPHVMTNEAMCIGDNKTALTGYVLLISDHDKTQVVATCLCSL